MIEFKMLKQDLLNILTKSFHKVLVEKTVERDGKTFREHYWVSPDKIKPDEKVRYNRHLLADNHPQRHKYEDDLMNHIECYTEEDIAKIFGDLIGTDGPLSEWFDHKTFGEMKSIKIYTGGPCKAINSYLRGIYDPEDAKTNKDDYWNTRMLKLAVSTIQQLDKAISRFDTPVPIRVRRVVSKDMLPQFIEAAHNKDGIFVEDGYCSTSLLQGSFGDEEVDISMVIDVPAGRGIGMYIDPLSEYPGEYEYLMARGTMLKIKSITPATKTHGPIIEMEAVGRKENNSVPTPNELAEQLLKEQLQNIRSGKRVA